MKTHVVVTVYTGARRPIVHAWGPYTESRAKHERRKVLFDYAADVEAGDMLVVACKMIDIDAMNAAIEPPAGFPVDAETTQEIPVGEPALYSSRHAMSRDRFPMKGITKVEEGGAHS